MIDGGNVSESEPSLWQGLRAAGSALADDVVPFFVVSAGWLATALVALGLGRLHVLFSGLLVLLLPATGALARMAGRTVRDRPARFRDALDGTRHRWPLLWTLGTLHLVIVGVAWVNVQVALASPRTVLVLAAVASANVAAAVTALAVAAWPLLFDPARDALPARQLLRLALAVVAVRPGRVLATVVVGVVFVAISLQTVVGPLALVALGVLLAAHVAVPIADGLAPPAE